MLENCQYHWSRCSNAFHLLLISTIWAQLSLENQCWPLDILIEKNCTPAVHSFTQVRILILHLSFINHFFTLCFNQLQYLHFLCYQVMLWMLFSSFSYVTFVTSICEITYILRGFRTDDRGDYLLPIDSNTLPLCHRRLWTCIFLNLNLHWFFKILNITVCNLIVLSLYYMNPDIVHIVITD